MLKGREIRGLAVLAGNKREEIGRVLDLLVDDFTGNVGGLVIQAGGVIAKSLYVDMQNIKQITKKGVIVPNKSHIKRLPKKSETLGQKGWVGSKLYTFEGQDKGTVADILFKDGKIAGFEVSSGLVGDLYSRRDFLPWQNIHNRGGDFYEENFNYNDDYKADFNNLS